LLCGLLKTPYDLSRVADIKANIELPTNEKFEAHETAFTITLTEEIGTLDSCKWNL
jgi:hypothetical protein